MRALMVIGLAGLVTGAAAGQDLAEAKAQFHKWDRALNAVYGELKKDLPEEQFAKLQQDQRDWVAHRDYLAEWEARAQGREPAEDGSYWEVAASLTESRIEMLRAWKGIGAAGDWTGVYRDGYGGVLEMVERDGALHFTLNVVRGPTHHVGMIGGKAKLNGSTGWFELKAEGEEKPTWLTFLNNREGDGRIEVVGENTQPFHGARAYFDGSYLRVGLLAGAAADKVVADAAEGAER